MTTAAPALERGEGAASPFKGLAYFDSDERDQHRFGGRERDITSVTNAILRSRTFVLYGRSGLGKTSLLLAGVFPQLKLHGCTPVHVRTLEDPLADVREAFLDLVPGAKTEGLRELIEAVSQKDGGSLVAIVFDQFEEFFVRFSDQLTDRDAAAAPDVERQKGLRQKRETFIQEMGRLAADSELNLRLVWSLREDWFAEMQDFVVAIPDITDRAYRLLPLTAFGVRESILRSLKAAGVAFDTRLISGLVDTLAEYGFDPAILQVLCSEVWKKALESEERPIRLAMPHLEAVGGVNGVFRGYLNSVTAEVPSDDYRMRIQVRAVLDSLVTERRTKRAIKKLDFRRRGFSIETAELNKALELLTRHRLVREDRRGGDSWFELIHERLIEIILGWLDTDRDFFNFRAARNLVENSCRNPGWEENPELLLNPGQLDGTVGPFRDLLHFGGRERLFLVSSATYARSKDFQFWAQNAGLETSLGLLENLLKVRDNDLVRERAAEAAGRVNASVERFAPRLLELTIGDPSEKVRRAAGRSFAMLANDEHFGQLAKRLRERRSRSRATDALADVIDAGKLPTAVFFGRLRLGSAKRRLFRRRVRASLPELGERSRAGALTGLLASIVWVATAGAAGLRIALRELVPSSALDEASMWLTIQGICVLIGLPLGALMGWLTARRAGRDALFRGREVVSFRTMYGPGARRVGWFLVAWFALLLGHDIGARADGETGFETLGAWASFLSPVAAYLALLAWCGLLAALGRRSIEFGSKADWVRAWPWAFGGSLILPLCAWALAGEAAIREWLRVPSMTVLLAAPMYFVVASAMVGGLLIYVGILSPGRTLRGPALGSRDVGVVTIGARRWLGVGLSIATLLLFFHTNGMDGVMGELRRIDSDPMDVKFQFGAGPVDAEYLTLLTKRAYLGQPRLVDVVLSDGLRGSTAAGDLVSGSTIVMKGAVSQVALWSGSGAPVEHRFGIYPDSIREDKTLAIGKWHLAVVNAEQKIEGRLSGHLRRRFAAVGGDGDIRVILGAQGVGGEWCDGGSMLIEILGPPAGVGMVPAVVCKVDVPTADFSADPLVFPGSDSLDLTFELRDFHQHVVLPHGDTVTSVSFYPEPPGSATGGREGFPEALTASQTNGYLWSVDASKNVGHPRTIAFHDGQVNSAAFDSSGGRVITASNDRSARVFDVSGSLLKKLSHAKELNGAAFSHDGTRVVTASADGVARIWDLEGEGKVRHELSHEGTTVWKASFNHDDTLVATASGAGAFLWSAESGGLLRRLHHSGSVYAAVFSPDDRFLLTAGEDKKARVWPLSPGTDQAPEVLEHESAVWSVDFSSDGNRIVTGSSDGTVRFWERRDSGKFEREDVILRTQGGIWSVAFSPDGDELLTGSADKTARLWDLTRSRIPEETGSFYLFVKFGYFPKGA